MTQTYTYRVSKTGEIRGLWSDVLASIDAEKNVSRASNVEFNASLKKWYVELISPISCCLVDGYEKRADALNAERDFLNTCIVKGEYVWQ